LNFLEVSPVLQQFRNPRTGRLLGLGLLLIGSLAGSVALAACQPGQMQEANLAYRTAATFLQGGQWDQAVAQLKSAVDICAEHVDATRGLGDAYMGKGEFQNAVIWYNKVVNIPGYEPQAGDFGNTAKAFAKQKKYKEARVEYMKAQKLAPDDCGILFNLGVMHYATGFQAQSVEVLQHALEVCPQYKDNILKQLVKSAEKAAAKQKKAGNSAKAEYFQGLVNQYGGAAGAPPPTTWSRRRWTPASMPRLPACWTRCWPRIRSSPTPG
jgi:tetratricopeptide (TPR) repeat protein